MQVQHHLICPQRIMSHISILQIGSEYSLFATQNLQEVRKCIFWLICPDLAIMGIINCKEGTHNRLLTIAVIHNTVLGA